MNETQRKERVRVTLHRTLRGLAVVGRCIADLDVLLNDREKPTGLGRIANVLGTDHSDPRALFSKPFVDKGAMTMTWAGRTCPLKGLTVLCLAELLARRPNRMVPYDRLLEEVWDGQLKSDDTIRSTVRHLKRQLVAGGMSDLARQIRTRHRRCGLQSSPNE